jgi:alkaline phosphatase D
MTTRRQIVQAAVAAGLILPLAGRAGAQASAQGRNPFTLGVASGSPRDTSVVLWTRLAPDPVNGGGMTPGSASVAYRVWADAERRRLVREGAVATSDAKAHAVHLTLSGLEPGREYWYQFSFGGADSPVGRTRTTSPRDRTAKLALASCNHYETNHFAAFADMAAWSPDCVIHVGDYIYEGAPGALGPRTVQSGARSISFDVVRQHVGPETTTLWDYRNRYGLYKSDPSLQAAHAAAPWIVAMDDHEIDNNWAADIPQDPERQTPLEFRIRTLAALQAYYEHMPMEAPPSVLGIESDLQMYGLYRFGPAQVALLDTRQYRSDQPCGQGFPGDAACEAMNNPALTMTGAAQEEWLLRALAASTAPVNVIASQTWFAPYRYSAPSEGLRVNMDQWDGYPVQRQRVIDAMAQGVSTPVVLSGDWHSAAAMRIHKDPWDVKSKRIGHNFCGTSISSICGWAGPLEESKGFNPHVDYIDGMKRGYFRGTASANGMAGEFRAVEKPSDPASKSVTAFEARTRDL